MKERTGKGGHGEREETRRRRARAAPKKEKRKVKLERRGGGFGRGNVSGASLVSRGSNTIAGRSSRSGRRGGVRGCRLGVCNSVAGGGNSGSAGRSRGKRVRAAAVAGQGAALREVASSQRDLGSSTASPATAAAARQRDSPAGAAVAQPDGAGTSRAGAAAVAGRGTASRAAASPAAGRRAPTLDITGAERHGRRLAEVAEATVAEAPLILSQKEKEAGLSAAAKAMLQQARRLATTARAVAADNVRWRQARQTDAPAAYDGQNFFFAGYEGGPRGLHGVPSQPALRTHRSSILRAAVAPNLRCECRFPGHERERPCGHNAALSSLVIALAAQRHVHAAE